MLKALILSSTNPKYDAIFFGIYVFRTKISANCSKSGVQEVLKFFLIIPIINLFLALGNCYLGVSLYSDGICDESIGKIDAKEGMIYMSVNDNKPYQLSECPFYMYLTVKESPIELVEIELLEEENFLV